LSGVWRPASSVPSFPLIANMSVGARAYGVWRLASSVSPLSGIAKPSATFKRSSGSAPTPWAYR
jgi:hypothetical protein